jgi:hypothetical protein
LVRALESAPESELVRVLEPVLAPATVLELARVLARALESELVWELEPVLAPARELARVLELAEVGGRLLPRRWTNLSSRAQNLRAHSFGRTLRPSTQLERRMSVERAFFP